MGRPSHAFGCDKGDRVKQSQGPPLHGDLRNRLGDIARSRRENDSRNNSETQENDQDRGFREFQFQKNYGIKQLAKLDFLESGFQTSFKIPKKQETKESLKITEEITNEFGKILLEKEKPRSKSAKQRQRKKTRKAAEKEKHESESDNEICMKHKKGLQQRCTCKKCLNETCKGAIKKFRELEKDYSKTMPDVKIKTNVDNDKTNLSYKANSDFTAVEVTAAETMIKIASTPVSSEAWVRIPPPRINGVVDVLEEDLDSEEEMDFKYSLIDDIEMDPTERDPTPNEQTWFNRNRKEVETKATMPRKLQYFENNQDKGKGSSGILRKSSEVATAKKAPTLVSVNSPLKAPRVIKWKDYVQRGKNAATVKND